MNFELHFSVSVMDSKSATCDQPGPKRNDPRDKANLTNHKPFWDESFPDFGPSLAVVLRESYDHP